VYVVVAEAQDVAAMVTELANDVAEVAPILFSKPLANARTINSITTDWLRFDLTIVSRAETAWLAQDQLKPLFDRLAIYVTLPATANLPPNPPAEALLDIVHEFIRVLGLSLVVTGRDDPVVAQTGTNLLRDMLIRIMAFENGPQLPRGVLSLKRQLTSDQYAALMNLPALDATWPSIHARTRALAEQFLPRARVLAAQMGAAWPVEFERVTLASLKDRLGLDIRLEARAHIAASEAVLYIFSGLPGSGKSTLAQRIAQGCRAVYLRIDTIEQALRELCSFDVQGEGYRLAYRVASDNLRLGHSVVADSCNPIELTRREWEQVARDAGARFINIEIICSDSNEHRRRVQGRASEVPGLALPTWSDVETREYHAWSVERVVIETAGRSIEECVAELAAALSLYTRDRVRGE